MMSSVIISRCLLLPLVLLTALCVSCRKQAVVYPLVYPVKGVVHAIIPEKKTVTIAHERIPGYMEAMTMDFVVTNAAELTGLTPGDGVTFRMTITADNAWIDQVKRTGSNSPVPAPPAQSFRRAREVEPLAVGDRLPEYTFTNQLGRVVKLSQFKGQAYVLNFIFTRCPYPLFCPKASKSLEEAQALLKSMKDGPTNWHFLSVTIDPAYDTPARLKGYGKTYNADPDKWSFLTGDLEDITAITEQFGMQFWRDTPESLPNHNVRTIVIDTNGRVQWLTVENEWKPDVLVQEVVKAAKP